MTPLDQALQDGQTDENKRMDYYRLFLRSELFVSIEGPPAADGGSRRIAANEKFSLRIVMHEGNKILPVFDSLERLQVWAQAAARYVSLPAHALIAGLPSDVFVWLNTGTPFGKEFVPGELDWLREQVSNAGPSQVDVKNGAEVLVGAPVKIPQGVVERLTDCLRKEKEVQAAHLGQILIAGQDEAPHLALVVKLDQASDETMDAIFQEVGIAVQGLLDGLPLDLIPYTGGNVDEAIVQAVKPFYVRS